MSVTETRDARGTLGTVRNAVLLLDLLSEGPAFQQLTELADRSGLSVPTVHRLLRSLVRADLVEQDGRSSRYGLGPEVTRLSHRYLGRLPVLGALSPFLVPLRNEIRGTIHVAVLVRGSVVYVDRIDGDDGGLYRDSHRVAPALRTAAGRVLLSRASDEGRQEALAEAADTDLEETERQLRDWSQAPYLVTEGQEVGEPGEVAVPLLDSRGSPVAALAASLPSDASAERVAFVASHLSRTATAAARTLGNG